MVYPDVPESDGHPECKEQTDYLHQQGMVLSYNKILHNSLFLILGIKNCH